MMDKKTIQTFGVSLFLIIIIVQWYVPISFWLKPIFLFVALLNILGWMMDKYFVKKYGSETLPFAKETYPALFKKDKNYVNQSTASVHWRKIKQWWNKK